VAFKQTVKERDSAMQRAADQHMDQLVREVTAVKQDFRVRVNELESVIEVRRESLEGCRQE
jgi:hypothetical protein